MRESEREREHLSKERGMRRQRREWNHRLPGARPGPDLAAQTFNPSPSVALSLERICQDGSVMRLKKALEAACNGALPQARIKGEAVFEERKKQKVPVASEKLNDQAGAGAGADAGYGSSGISELEREGHAAQELLERRTIERQEIQTVVNPLLIVCSKLGRGELVEYLLKCGADPNLKESDKLRRSCLHLAATSGSVQSVRSLLENGADKRMTCSAGTTPKTLAVSVGNHRIAQILNSWVSAWELVNNKPRLNKPSDSGQSTESEQCNNKNELELLRSVLAQKEALFGERHPGLVPTLEKLAKCIIDQESESEKCDISEAVQVQERAAHLAGNHYKTLKRSKSSPDSLSAAGEQASLSWFLSGKLHARVRDFQAGEDAFILSYQYLESLNDCSKSELKSFKWDPNQKQKIQQLKQQPKAIQWSESRFVPAKVVFDRHIARKRKILESLALCLEAQQRFEHERQVLIQLIELVREETGDPDHPSIAYPLTVLGRVHGALGDHAAAEESLALALAISDKHLGPAHMDIAVCLDNLAQAFFVQEKFAHAEAIFRRSHSIREQLLHPIHDSAAMLVSENNISMAVVSRGQASKKFAKRRARLPKRHATKSSSPIIT